MIYSHWVGQCSLENKNSIARTVLSFESHLIELISNYVPRNIMFVISLRSQQSFLSIIKGPEKQTF